MDYKPVDTMPKLTLRLRQELHGKVGAFSFAGQLIDYAENRTELRRMMDARGLTNGIHWYAYQINSLEDENLPLFEIDLPFPPSVNHMYRHGYSGKRLLTKEAKTFREKVIVLVLNKWNREKAPLPIVGDIAVYIMARFPHGDRKRDIDNLLKATLDALQAAKVFCDDSQVAKMTIERGEKINDGSMMVQVRRLQS